MTKPTLYLLPLEPLEERYTGAWWRWLPETFAEEFKVVAIAGVPLSLSVEDGAFLDINSTLHYKASQLCEMARLFRRREVRSGDSFFVADIEFWGIESIRYLARLQGIDVKIYGFLHAGSYTPGDFMVPMADIGQFVEPAWVATCDKVFLGSEYHAELLRTTRLDAPAAHHLQDRLVVTGNPWRTAEAVQLAYEGREWREGRDIDVLFPHRPDAEKCPGTFVDFVQGMSKKLSLAFTTGREQYRSTNDPDSVGRIMQLVGEGRAALFVQLKRADFYSVCRRAKVTVSTAVEETFGYAMVEAMAQGSLPLMPSDLSYPMLVQGDGRFLYERDNAEDFRRKLDVLLRLDGLALQDAQDHIRACCLALDGAEARILKVMVDDG